MSSSSSSSASPNINAEISGASSDPLVAKAIANIKSEHRTKSHIDIKDHRQNLFTKGRDHPLFHAQTNNTLSDSESVSDVLDSNPCPCAYKFLKDRRGGFADLDDTQLLNYEPEGSASRLFKNRFN